MYSQTLVIDGYNIIRQVAGLLAAEAGDLSAGRQALLAQVISCYRNTAHRVIVVFDGAGPTQSIAPLRCGVGSQVIFSARGESADEVIARLITRERRAGHQVLVATNDLAIRLSGQREGATTTGASELAARLNAAPRHMARAARHRAGVRAQLERDPADKARGGTRHTSRKGNPHRAPRKRRGERRDVP